jgi:hypothetical protein
METTNLKKKSKVKVMKVRACIDIAKRLEENTARQMKLLAELRMSLAIECRKWLEENPEGDVEMRVEALSVVITGLEDLAREVYGIKDLTKRPRILYQDAKARKLRDDWKGFIKQRADLVPSIAATLPFSNGEDREGLT